MARRPLVTGQGAKYVAAGRKQQAANAGKSMVAGHSAGMASMYAKSQGNPSVGDHTPAPPSSTPQHLSGQQFSYATSSMHPGGAGMGKSFVPRGQTTMHPGGSSFATGPRKTQSSSYLPGSGNLKSSGKFGASSTQTPVAAPAATSHWDEDAFPGVLPASPGTRGNADTSATKALGGKARRSRPAKQASVGGNAGGQSGRGRTKLRALIPRPSRHAGKLQQHLRNATGSA